MQENGDTQPIKPILAMIALNSADMPGIKNLAKSFYDLSGIKINTSSEKTEDNALNFSIGKDSARLILISEPIPWSQLEGPCATAWWWPEAAEKMRGHTHHLIVTYFGKSEDLVGNYLTLTRLVSAAAAHTNAAGIYWGAGTLVHEPNMFTQQTAAISRENLPLDLWIDFRIGRNEDGSFSLVTTGMKEFNHLEIEILQSFSQPDQIMDFVFTIAHYIIAADVDVRDGETIGRTAEEKIPARHLPSIWDKSETALRLDF